MPRGHKGAPKTPGSGRKKGSENKTSGRAREAIAQFVEDNVPQFNQWLQEIYRDEGAKAAMESVVGLIEYHIPKLARTETETKVSGNVLFGWSKE